MLQKPAYRIIFLSVMMVILTSCAGTSPYEFSYSGSPFGKLSMTSLFDNIAEELCQDESMGKAAETSKNEKINGNRKNGQAGTLLVTDFVDLQTYVPQYSGVLMGELMRSSLSRRCRANVVQVEFSRYFKLSGQGLVALTRASNEIMFDEYPLSQSIVGTYSMTLNKIFIFARRIDVGTGKISRMVSKEIDIQY